MRPFVGPGPSRLAHRRAPRRHAGCSSLPPVPLVGGGRRAALPLAREGRTRLSERTLGGPDMYAVFQGITFFGVHRAHRFGFALANLVCSTSLRQSAVDTSDAPRVGRGFAGARKRRPAPLAFEIYTQERAPGLFATGH